MRRLSSILQRPTRSARTSKPRPEAINETAAAPKPRPRRCLNEGGHKQYR